MLHVAIPGAEDLDLEHLVMDVNVVEALDLLLAPRALTATLRSSQRC
jgi:hypothetical protein